MTEKCCRGVKKERCQKREFKKEIVKKKRVQQEMSKRNFQQSKHLTHVRIDSPTADNNLPSVTTPFKK
jgi:hypothetical protein